MIAWYHKNMTLDDQILACESDLRAAQLSSDVAALDRLLDDLLIFTYIDGNLATTADDLNMHRSGRLRITKMDPSDRRLLHLGETSIVNVRMESEAVIDGTPVSAQLRYTRVWHKRPDGWRVVAGHLTVFPPSGGAA